MTEAEQSKVFLPQDLGMHMQEAMMRVMQGIAKDKEGLLEHARSTHTGDDPVMKAETFIDHIAVTIYFYPTTGSLAYAFGQMKIPGPHDLYIKFTVGTEPDYVIET
jgi:hypothetical protein